MRYKLFLLVCGIFEKYNAWMSNRWLYYVYHNEKESFFKRLRIKVVRLPWNFENFLIWLIYIGKNNGKK